MEVWHEPTRACPDCNESLPENCFRKNDKSCIWCTWKNRKKRARARYRDKQKLAFKRLKISIEEFEAWYDSQPDECAYCGLTYQELSRLRIRRGGGYCVGWDIDRIDSQGDYEKGNLALSCFVCNMAKGDILTGQEARLIGKAVRQIWNARLDSLT